MDILVTKLLRKSAYKKIATKILIQLHSKGSFKTLDHSDFIKGLIKSMKKSFDNHNLSQKLRLACHFFFFRLILNLGFKFWFVLSGHDTATEKYLTWGSWETFKLRCQSITILGFFFKWHFWVVFITDIS